MSLIFPGMDPYLEHPRVWPGVHNSLIVYLRDHLQPQLDPRYIASVEDRVYLEGPDREVIPDVWLRHDRPTAVGPATALAVVDEAEAPVVVEVPELEVHEPFVAILDREAGERVVTVIEVISPANKFAGPGRTSYLNKQAEVRRSDAHLVEVDLLRAGPHVAAVPEWASRGRGEYASLTCVNRAVGTRSRFELYPTALRSRLPRIRVPLAGDDPDATLDLQAVLAQTYDAGRYRNRLRYAEPCIPTLPPDDQAWADGLIRAATVGGSTETPR